MLIMSTPQPECIGMDWHGLAVVSWSFLLVLIGTSGWNVHPPTMCPPN